MSLTQPIGPVEVRSYTAVMSLLEGTERKVPKRAAGSGEEGARKKRCLREKSGDVLKRQQIIDLVSDEDLDDHDETGSKYEDVVPQGSHRFSRARRRSAEKREEGQLSEVGGQWSEESGNGEGGEQEHERGDSGEDSEDDSSAGENSEDSEEACLAGCLAALDARSLRALKGVSRAWRRRARRMLSDPGSAWRQRPEWSAGAFARDWYGTRLGSQDEMMRKR